MKKRNVSFIVSALLGTALIYFISKEKKENTKDTFETEDKISINVKPKKIYTRQDDIFLDKYVKLNIKDVYFTYFEKTHTTNVNIDIEINNTSGEDFFLDKSLFIKNNSSLEEFYPLNMDKVLIKNTNTLEDTLIFNFKSFILNKSNKLTILYTKDMSEVIKIKLLG